MLQLLLPPPPRLVLQPVAGIVRSRVGSLVAGLGGAGALANVARDLEAAAAQRRAVDALELRIGRGPRRALDPAA